MHIKEKETSFNDSRFEIDRNRKRLVVHKIVKIINRQKFIYNMVFDSWKLNDTLIKLEALQCSYCNQIVKPPIMSSRDGFNVCLSCLNENEKTSGNLFRNYALEEICKHLHFPCRYYENGCCETRINYEDLSGHEKKCVYRIYHCPTYFRSNCTWQGNVVDMLIHMRSDHCDVCVENNIDIIRKETENESLETVIKFFMFNNQQFVLRICFKDEVFYYEVCQLENDYSGESCYIMRIKLDEAVEFRDQSFEIREPILKATDFKLAPTDKNKLNGFALICLSKYIQKEGVTVEIIPQNSLQNEVEVMSMKTIECPVCSSCMKDQIFMCSKGHSICNTCAMILKTCPICRVNISTKIRNLLVESIADNMYFSCEYDQYGCQVKLCKAEIKKHEKQCNYRQYLCTTFTGLSCDCKFKGSLLSIRRHLREIHRKKVFFKNPLVIENIFLKQNTQICMLAFDRIFKITINNDNLQISPAYGADAFDYKIGYFYNYKESVRKFTESQPEFYYIDIKESKL